MSSTTKTDIHSILQKIPLTSEEIYDWFFSQRLTFYQRQKWGFPIIDPQIPGETHIYTHSFFCSMDPSKQICRCGKAVSLLEKDWYIDEAGCSYHWGKKDFSGGPGSGVYSCCNRTSEQNGCMHHKYHACNYKPLQSALFVQTSGKGEKCFDSSNIFALDCEMVYTTAGMEIAKVSLISIRGEVILDKFIQPKNEIVDFNTPFSGIKPDDLAGVTNTISGAQVSLLQVLNKHSILIGHGLENDLISLHLVHENIVDTSLIYMHEKGFPYRYSLKNLALKYLNIPIHYGFKGHNSIEDARICIVLMLQRFYLQSQNPFFKSPEIPKNSHSFQTTEIFKSSQNPYLKSPETLKTYVSQPIPVENFGFYRAFKPSAYVVKHGPFVYSRMVSIPKSYQSKMPYYLLIPPPKCFVMDSQMV